LQKGKRKEGKIIRRSDSKDWIEVRRRISLGKRSWIDQCIKNTRRGWKLM